MNDQAAEFKLVQCQFDVYGKEILSIFNHAILHTLSLYEYKPRAIYDIQRWFDHKNYHQFPVLGIIDTNNRLAGFASYSHFRPQAAFQHTIEHSIYVHPYYQTRGLGKILLHAIIDHARQKKFRTMIAAIDSTNTPSISLHQKLGFQYAGIIQQSGYKFDQWLDLVFYQLML